MGGYPDPYNHLGSMRVSRRVAISTVGFLLLTLMCSAPFVGARLHWWRFVHKVRTKCDPVVLQRWATELRGQLSGDDYFDATGTNLPPGISDVLSWRPSVYANPDSEAVIISWGRGDPALFVGSPTYVFTNRPAEVWVPGVFLMKPTE
jgi:hypothetical protein